MEGFKKMRQRQGDKASTYIDTQERKLNEKIEKAQKTQSEEQMALVILKKKDKVKNKQVGDG